MPVQISWSFDPRKFRADESGDILVFSVFTLVVMALIGGIAIDIGYYERSRTDLQTTLDSAVLSAASLSQELDPQEAVDSYMASAGFPDLPIDVVTSTEKIGGILVGRTVSASLQEEHKTLLLQLLGQETLNLGVSAEATERVDNIEISLVLDVSGSMEHSSNDGKQKIEHLREAASGFVEDVLEDTEKGRVSISIVPYSTKVNIGKALLDELGATQEHDYSHCVDFDAGDYTSAALDLSAPLPRTGHFQFQAMSTHSQRQHLGQWTCRIDDGFEVTPFSDSIADLKIAISKLSPEGSTSIDMGVKWGLALLDPSTRPAVSQMAQDGLINPGFSVRPYDHDENHALKVLVIMTDGENDDEYRLRPEYASGLSGVFKDVPLNGNISYYSIRDPETDWRNDGWAPDNEEYFHAISPLSNKRAWSNYTIKNHPEWQNKANYYIESELTWPELWNDMSPLFFGYYFKGQQHENKWLWDNEAYDFIESMREAVLPAEKNNRLKNVCKAAEDVGVVTYAIGFDGGADGSLELLEECASTEAHYFHVEGLEIESAFEMIASSISMLRLTK